MPDSTKRPVLRILGSHWLSSLGAALVTTAAFSWLFVLPMHISGRADNPYIGIIVFLVIPVVFFAGLALIPVGAFLAKRRLEKGYEQAPDHASMLRRIGAFLAATTVLNVVIGTQITYRAVEHLETVQFCGQTCHVMKPEFTAHLVQSHAAVACVECHVSPGASGWLKAKTAGTRQLIEVVFNSFPRPIPSALESNRLVSSAETCEKCHWKERPVGQVQRTVVSFKDDEANTKEQTVLSMSVGGGGLGGIHGAHMGAGVSIRYKASDPKRQTIPWVAYENARTGVKRTFVATDSKSEAIAGMVEHEMECADCHNRPTHAFLLPERAVDEAMAAGRIPALPYMKKTAVDVLKANYTSEDEASKEIPSRVIAFYREKYPSVSAADAQRAGNAILTIYGRNVFPDLKVTWGTYPSNLGHTDSPGCFRCHDESHVASDKKTISQDCALCHSVS